MYNQEIQEKVNNLLKQNIAIKEINRETGVSVSTISRWAKIRESRVAIKELIANQKYAEAMKMINFNLSQQTVYKSVFISYKLKVLLKQRKYEEAEQLARSSLIDDPKNRFFRGQLISSLMAQDKYVEAESLARASLIEDPNNAIQKGQMVRVLKGQYKLEEAEQLVKELLLRDPKNYFLREQANDIWMCKRMQATNASDAIAYKEDLFQTVREQEYSTESIGANLEKISLLKQYIKDNKDNKEAVFLLAEVYYKLKLQSLAIKTCKTVLHSDSVDANDLKVFKGMIEIVKSHRPIFYDTEQKIDGLAKMLRM